MTMRSPRTAPSAEGVARLLEREFDPSITHVSMEPLEAGYSNGAWQVDAHTASGPVEFVVKAPRAPSVVHRFDPLREADLVDALGRRGAPVPRIVAISRGDGDCGGTYFVMERVAGRSVADDNPAGPHGPGWFRDSDPEARRAIWESFHDRLAELHRTDIRGLDAASHGPAGSQDVLAYWREALLDVVDAGQAPRQLAALDWLAQNLPADADASPAVCMGDARLVNGIVSETEVAALVDFEVVYIGNPVADIGYSLFVDGRHRMANQAPLDGLPTAEETWQRWTEATGRDAVARDYWTAFGATVIVITASRAIVQWGGDAASFDEAHNPLVVAWESVLEEAGR